MSLYTKEKQTHKGESGGWGRINQEFGINIYTPCCAKLLQSCPTLWDPVDCSLPDSSVHGIPQARILEWVAISSSRGSSRPRDRACGSYISCIDRQVFTTSAIWEAHIHTPIRKTDTQQGPTVQYRQFYSIFCSNQIGKDLNKNKYMCNFAVQLKQTQHCELTKLQYIYI